MVLYIREQVQCIYGSYNSDNTYSRLWAAKGRLIASDTSGVLYEIEPSSASAGADTTIHSLRTGRNWTDVCDAGAAYFSYSR